MDLNAKFQELTSSFKGVNWNNPGSWPAVVKTSVYAAAFAFVMLVFYSMFITKLNTQLKAEHHKETSLLKDYEEKAFKAMNLDAYKKQLADMEEAFGALLRQLPKDTEVPSLLEDINHTGLGSGLEFETIDLGEESKKEFYAELPINIKVRGDYHGFGAFVSGVASLPRIVTLDNFSIKTAADDQASKKKDKGDQYRGPRVLEMTITAKTYRYSDESEGSGEGGGEGDGHHGNG